MSKYMKHGMELLYLDQCATSEIYRDTRGRWGDILGTLSDGVRRRRLMCPRSIEHLFETSGLADEQAIALDAELHELSFRRSFLPEADIAAVQLVLAVRTRTVTVDDFLRKDAYRSIGDDGTLPYLRHVKGQFDDCMKLIYQPTNEIRDLTRGIRGPKIEDKNLIVQAIKETRKEQLIDRLKPLSRGTFPDLGVRTVGSLSFPHWAAFLCLRATTNQGLTAKEAGKALRIVETHGIDVVPTVMIRAEIEALGGILELKDEPADQWDIMRIAAALPYADAMVVDGGRQAQIMDLKLDSRFKTEVFATRAAEQERLLKYLRAHVHRRSATIRIDHE